MSTQIDRVQTARAARTIRVAAIALALLVMGLAIGLTFGRLQIGSAERPASTSVTVAPSAARAPVPTGGGDDATRHRHLGQLPTVPVPIGWNDYATRREHLGGRP
jgi:hypothetical protein